MLTELNYGMSFPFLAAVRYIDCWSFWASMHTILWSRTVTEKHRPVIVDNFGYVFDSINGTQIVDLYGWTIIVLIAEVSCVCVCVHADARARSIKLWNCNSIDCLGSADFDLWRRHWFYVCLHHSATSTLSLFNVDTHAFFCRRILLTSPSIHHSEAFSIRRVTHKLIFLWIRMSKRAITPPNVNWCGGADAKH